MEPVPPTDPDALGPAERPYRCECGSASGDLGEYVIHAVDAIGDGVPGPHRLTSGDTPPEVLAAEDRAAAIAQNQARLVDVLGMPLADIRDALHGLI
ncbi:hypothetical protein [Stackebrandtia soli]|uniref:hypothetical protein n=1 Tax=Stackebrandtia soli TaxID=1892856 RepID=UPI0039E78858